MKRLSTSIELALRGRYATKAARRRAVEQAVAEDKAARQRYWAAVLRKVRA